MDSCHGGVRDTDAIAEIIRTDPEVAILTGSVHSSTEPFEAPPLEELRVIHGRWAAADDRLVLAVVDHGLTTMGLHRISLEVYAFNPRARHVYEKVGFVHEGTGRDALIFDGEWIDVHFMAILVSASGAE